MRKIQIFIIFSIALILVSPLLVGVLGYYTVYYEDQTTTGQGVYQVPLTLSVATGGGLGWTYDVYGVWWWNAWGLWRMDQSKIFLSAILDEGDHYWYPKGGAQLSTMGVETEPGSQGDSYTYIIQVEVWDGNGTQVLAQNLTTYSQKASCTAIHNVEISIPTGEDRLPSSSYVICVTLIDLRLGGYTVGTMDNYGQKLYARNPSYTMTVWPDITLAEMQTAMKFLREGYVTTYSILFFLLIMPLSLCVGYLFGERRDWLLILAMIIICLFAGFVLTGFYMELATSPAYVPASIWDVSGLLNGWIETVTGFMGSAQSQMSHFINGFSLELLSMSLGLFGGYLVAISERKIRS